MGGLRLAMSVPAPVIPISDTEVMLDIKFVDGMSAHLAHWDGEIDCFMRRGVSNIQFGRTYAVRDLGFKVRILDSGAPPPLKEFQIYDVAMLSGDSDVDILRKSAIRSAGCPIVYAVEYTHGTRQNINRLETRPSARQIVRAGRIVVSEYKRRRAFSASAGMQMNGYPAYDDYGALSSSHILYLDNRATSDIMATPLDMDRRRQRLLSGGPLRLYYSGRLERMKGAHQLIPLAAALRDAGIPFSLDIYGDGALRADMESAKASHGLAGSVRLHDPVDFRTGLVPMLRSEADLFVSCHLQSDPSCTYLETLACGVPIVGYDNRMWGRLNAASGGGWAVTAGNVPAMAREIGRLHRDRGAMVDAAARGLAFARAHDFDSQFRNRMNHLAGTAGRPHGA